jgi:hypothetical protein
VIGHFGTTAAILCGLLLVGRAAAPQSLPSVPRQWVAFLVAGDAVQPVFDNFVGDFGKVLEAQGVVVKRFSSQAHLPAGTHVATQRAIIRSAHQAASSPDTGCLFYVTSHGGVGAMNLVRDTAHQGQLRPGGLAETVEAVCDGRPTVVVLSGCHAASMMTASLTITNRVVIAAARADRTSFGCSTREHFTYFDGCLMSAWPAALTWRQLFAATTACVRGLEQAEGDIASEPQNFFGSAVTDLALPGSRPALP